MLEVLKANQTIVGHLDERVTVRAFLSRKLLKIYFVCILYAYFLRGSQKNNPSK